MENQPNVPNLNPSAPPTEPHKSFSHWLVVSCAILSVVGYFMISYSLALWPFQSLLPQLPQGSPVVKLEDMDKIQDNTVQVPADWKTYTNTEYGFEFKYPGESEYRLSSNSDISLVGLVGAVQSDGRGGAILLSIKKSDNSFLDTVNGMSRQKNDDRIPMYISDREFAIGGVKAHEFKYGTAIGGVFFNTIVNSSPVVIIEYKNYLGEISEKDYTEIIDQILSTFKFVDKADTSDWKTYTNTEYGFEFKYPGDWHFKQDSLNNQVGLLLLDPPEVSPNNHNDTDLPYVFMISLYPDISYLDWRRLGAKNLDDFISKYSSSVDDPYIKDIENISIGINKWYKANAGPNVFGGGEFYFIEKGNKIYEVKLFNLVGAEWQYSDVTSQILSTFRFTK